ncbi:MAG TPA: TolC family outer membrane protein [Rhizomicrobium sp.]|nr:TolC family outer membrane protein [Rhizomicrobium sp.]
MPISRAIVCACALAAIGLPGLAGATDIFTLRDALGVAYETNPQLDAQRASLRATDENVPQANAGWRPTINAQGTYGFDNNDASFSNTLHIPQLTHPLTSQIVVSQPLYRGGRTVAEVGRAKAQVRAGRAQLTNTEENVLLDAVTAYMDVVRDAKSLKLKQTNVADLQKQLDATVEQRKVGELTLTDVAQARARLSGAQADLVNAQGQLQVSRSSFEHTIGRPAETLEQRPPMPVMPATLDEAVQIALKISPFLLQAQENAKAADYAVDDAAAAMQPQVAVQGEYQYAQGQPTGFANPNTQTNRVTAVIGQVTVPIYQGGADEAQLRQSKEQRSQARLAIADAERQVLDATRSAWESYRAAVASIASQRTEVAADQTALDGVRQEQQVGTRTVLDVLNAEQELLNAEVAEVDAERDATVAAFQLLSAMGKLTAQSLTLQVKYYDPQKHYDEDSNRWFGFGD